MDDLEQLRKKVDKIDNQILDSLDDRAKICKEIGSIKRKQRLQIRDNSRENEIYERVKKRAVKFALDPVQVEQVFREIVNMCSAVQE